MSARRLSTAARVGLMGLGALILVAIVAPLVAGGRADELTDQLRQGASWQHPLGTDVLGHDMLARTFVAARLTLLMAAGATLVALGLGALLGTAVALAGRRMRAVGERAIELLIAFPAVLLAIVVATVLSPSGWSATLAVGLALTPAFARMTNSLATTVSGRDHVVVARLLGRHRGWILRRHIVPNIRDTLLILTSICFASAVVSLSALGFLGLGVQPPSYDWGSLLNQGLQSLYTNPVQAIGPAVGILLIGLFAGLLGDGIAVALAPGALGTRAVARAAAPALADAPAPATDAGGVVDGHVVVRDLHVRGAGGAELVRGVSFALQRGEIVGLVGESGSGKTLTAMSIAGLLPGGLALTAAELRIGEIDLLGSADPRALATSLGVVFQDPSSSLNPALRIGSQVTEVARVHGGASRAAAARAAVQAFDEVRLPEPERKLRRYPHELSGGQRQRVMLAGALVNDPSVIVADEPTTALDVTVQAEILLLLRRANERHGAAILFISHDIAVVGQLCHRVLVMQHGRIVEDLPIERLRAGDAQHPHTRTLLAAAPLLDARGDGARERPDDGGTDPATALAVRDLRIGYDASAAPVVDGVSFALRRGRALGLVGESGSGKSTIARAIVGIVSAQSGSVQLDGEELTALRGASRRSAVRRVQLVPQDPYASLNPRMTVSAAIAEGCDPTLRAAERARDVERLLGDVALDPALAERYPHQLSGGQRQRVAIARALAARPAILIADEITSALDTSVQAGVLDLLRDLRAELDLTLLFISHDLAVVSQVCDDVAVLHRGRIVEQGAIADVFAVPQAPYTRALLDAVPRLEAPTPPSIRR